MSTPETYLLRHLFQLLQLLVEALHLLSETIYRSFAFGGEYIAVSRGEYIAFTPIYILTQAVTTDHFTSHEALQSQIRREYDRLQALHVPSI